MVDGSEPFEAGETFTVSTGPEWNDEAADPIGDVQEIANTIRRDTFFREPAKYILPDKESK